MIKKLTLLSMVLLGTISALDVEAKVTLPALLCDNAVLQRNENVVLWGSSDQSKPVAIKTSWNDKEYKAKVAKDGSWRVEVTTSEAGGPYSITFDDGDETTISNIMLGEVWLTSGQSNMELTMMGNPTQPIAGAADAILKAKESTPIRMFKVEKSATVAPQSDVNGSWKTNAHQNVPNFSATSYFFAKYLNEVLDVPVGIINASWGGSKLEAWMSRSMLESFKEYDFSHIDNNKISKNPLHSPAVMYNGMLAPLKNYKFKGMLWYQGEANRENKEEYKELFPIFVNTLRDYYSCGNFPVYYAQIAPFDSYGNGDGVVLMREAMCELAHRVDNCGMVTLTDVGEMISIHPRYKKEVGERFAYWALGATYGYDQIDYRAPEYKAMKVKNDKKRGNVVAICFDYAPRGVCFKGEESVNFEIAGEDKVFYPAKTRLFKNSDYPLEVWSEKVPNPVAVRYAFKGFVIGDMFNSFGVPVSSFRTDNWDL